MVWAKPVTNKGQSTLEAVYSLLLSFMILALMGLATLRSLISLWVDHFTYEAAICFASYPSQEESCRQELEKQLRALWPLGKLSISFQQYRVHGHFEFLRGSMAFDQLIDIPY